MYLDDRLLILLAVEFDSQNRGIPNGVSQQDSLSAERFLDCLYANF